ncbi:hypothetical protein LCGC14_0498650 [marine sediment metagenome]|uniref:Uncharacterized protein n=1 Tax=marine sediment metagenome TaxID=412755 RepID=A0A0F9URJ9_9ZZZZ
MAKKARKTRRGKGLTCLELVREYFPDSNDDEAGYILWEHTGFPSFWNIPKDGATPEACCRKQLKEFKSECVNSIC